MIGMLSLGLCRILVFILRPRCAIRVSSGWALEKDGLLGEVSCEWTEPWVLA